MSVFGAVLRFSIWKLLFSDKTASSAFSIVAVHRAKTMHLLSA